SRPRELERCGHAGLRQGRRPEQPGVLVSRVPAERQRGERGAVMVLVAVCLPALALLAAFAIDVAHWYDYSRNLQLRADAAALAGGDQFGGICTPSSPSLTAMSAVGKMAQLYSGPPVPTDPSKPSDLYYPYS